MHHEEHEEKSLDMCDLQLPKVGGEVLCGRCGNVLDTSQCPVKCWFCEPPDVRLSPAIEFLVKVRDEAIARAEKAEARLARVVKSLETEKAPCDCDNTDGTFVCRAGIHAYSLCSNYRAMSIWVVRDFLHKRAVAIAEGGEKHLTTECTESTEERGGEVIDSG